MRLSLGSLLLIVTVIALALSHIITSRKLAATQAELIGYRYQYGHLVVDDPTRPHVLGYAEHENPQTVSQIFPRTDVYTNSVFNKFSIGHGDSFTAELGQPFVIFYQTERKANVAAGSVGSENGVVVWVAPVK
jgi:hypothetical protein